MIMPKTLVFVLKKRITYLTEPTCRPSAQQKVDQTFFTENVVRSGMKSRFLGPKHVPFCCKNANLPNRTCFTRIQTPLPKQRSDGFPLEFLLKGPQAELRTSTLSQNCEQTLQKLRTERIMNNGHF